MKRLLLLALIVLVSLVGMIGISSAAADLGGQTVFTQLEYIQQTLSAISNAVSTLQATANAANGAVSTLKTRGDDVDPPKHKMYYLTVTGFSGGDAITACDSGFHMASLSEVQDTSNLQYVNRSPTVYDSLVDNSGLGPPSNQKGWIRSGVYPPSGFVYDCNDFSNEHNVQFGTTVALHSFSINAGPGQPTSHQTMWWHATLHPCNQPEPAWCVEDPESEKCDLR